MRWTILEELLETTVSCVAHVCWLCCTVDMHTARVHWAVQHKHVQSVCTYCVVLCYACIVSHVRMHACIVCYACIACMFALLRFVPCILVCYPLCFLSYLGVCCVWHPKYVRSVVCCIKCRMCGVSCLVVCTVVCSDTGTVVSALVPEITPSSRVTEMGGKTRPIICHYSCTRVFLYASHHTCEWRAKSGWLLPLLLPSSVKGDPISLFGADQTRSEESMGFSLLNHEQKNWQDLLPIASSLKSIAVLFCAP